MEIWQQTPLWFWQNRLAQTRASLADIIVAELVKDDDVASAVVAGPGFINIVAKPEFWFGQLAIILDQQSEFGRSTIGNGQKVNVEYVSANPTGPMHVGHCRGAVIGDALASLLDFAGYDVTREYYVNDAGGQIDVLARSVFLRYREALGEVIGKIPEGLYPGDYLVPVGKMLANEYGDKLLKMSDEEWLPIVKPVSIDAMMDLIRADLDALNVRHDVFFSERSLHELNPAIIQKLPMRLMICAIKGLFIREPCRRQRGRSRKTGKTASNCCFVPPMWATTLTGHVG